MKGPVVEYAMGIIDIEDSLFLDTYMSVRQFQIDPAIIKN